MVPTYQEYETEVEYDFISYMILLKSCMEGDWRCNILFVNAKGQWTGLPLKSVEHGFSQNT